MTTNISIRAGNRRDYFIVLALIFGLIICFALAPLPGGDDWEIFSDAAGKVIHGQSLYTEIIPRLLYSNPPWLATLLIPLAILPFRLGRAVVSVITLIVSLLLLRRWVVTKGIVKPVLLLLSPPIVYILLHGQIDALVLAGIFLPVQFWWLVALTKPQVAIGLAFGVPRQKWLLAFAITIGGLALSFLFFGNWPLQLLHQPAPFITASHNVWASLWPFQIPIGVAILVLGIGRKDERLLVASSPFLAPYAAISSFLGPWIVALTFLNDWQALLVFLSWWGAVAYRAFA